MQKYNLYKLNNIWDQLLFAFSPMIFLAFIAVFYAWGYSYYGELGLAFIILAICIFLLGNFLKSIRYEAHIEDDILYIRNTKTNVVRKTNLDIICAIRHDRITFDLSMRKFPKDQIVILFKKGKTIFACNNNLNPNSFYAFLSELRNLLHTTDHFIYNKRLIKPVETKTLFREFLINPNYENSKIVKKLERENSFHYPIIILIIVVILFVVFSIVNNRLI